MEVGGWFDSVKLRLNNPAIELELDDQIGIQCLEYLYFMSRINKLIPIPIWADLAYKLLKNVWKVSGVYLEGV